MSKRDQSPTVPEPPADAWRDAWSEDREVARVWAHIDDRYSEDDYRSALRRAMSETA